MTAPAFDVVGFDLDGTLVDTAAEIAAAANAALALHGIGERPLDEITNLIGGGFGTLMRRLMEGRDADEDAVLASADARYAEIAGTVARPYTGCVEALAALRGAGVRLACVTNKEERYARRVLDAAGIGDAFDLVVGGDTLAVRKPDAGVLRHVASTLGADLGRAAHVGDSAIDVAAARNAGVAAWVVPYGYNGGRPIAEARPDRVFADLRAVADHVLGCG